MSEARCRRLVYDRSDGLCERCGRKAHSVHHRRNRSQGGLWDPDNCVHLCGDGVQGCHGWVTDNSDLAHDEGLHLTAGEPLTTPLLRRNEWVVLYDDGTFSRWIPDAKN